MNFVSSCAIRNFPSSWASMANLKCGPRHWWSQNAPPGVHRRWCGGQSAIRFGMLSVHGHELSRWKTTCSLPPRINFYCICKVKRGQVTCLNYSFVQVIRRRNLITFVRVLRVWEWGQNKVETASRIKWRCSMSTHQQEVCVHVVNAIQPAGT